MRAAADKAAQAALKPSLKLTTSNDKSKGETVGMESPEKEVCICNWCMNAVSRPFPHIIALILFVSFTDALMYTESLQRSKNIRRSNAPPLSSEKDVFSKNAPTAQYSAHCLVDPRWLRQYP